MHLLLEKLGESKLFAGFLECLAKNSGFHVEVQSSDKYKDQKFNTKCPQAWIVFSDQPCEITLSNLRSRSASPAHTPLIIVDARYQSSLQKTYLSIGATEYFDYENLDINVFSLTVKIAARIYGLISEERSESIKFGLLCETLNVGTWDWDLRKNSFEWSAREYELFGIDPSVNELVYESWCNAIHPQDRERVEAELGRAMVGQSIYHSVFRVLRHRDGQSPTLHWIEGAGRVERDEQGAALYMHGLNWDVTDKYKALADLEAKRSCTNCLSHYTKNTFQSYFEQSADCLFHLIETIDGRLLYTAMNPSGLHHAGLTLNQILGRTPSDVLGKEIGGAIEAGMQAALQSRKPFFYKPTFDMGEGSVAYDAVYIPIIDEHNRITGVLGCARDITADRRMEESLFRAQKMEALGHITSGTAHDFNNVLQTITSALDMFEKVQISENRKNALKICRNAIKFGNALTSGLLAFSRKEELITKPGDINLMIAGMTEMIRLTLGAGISLQIDSDPTLDQAMINEQQIELAIINLPVNAKDAMPGGGKLTITTRNIDVTGSFANLKPGKYVGLTVSDTGIGMEPEILAKAMEAFYTTKPPGKGTGLGLSMVRSTVANLEGGVEIASEKGKGTSVTIYLKPADTDTKITL